MLHDFSVQQLPSNHTEKESIMPTPIALQLYTIREAMNQDFEGAVRKVAEMGYAGVETAGFPGTTPAKAAALFNSLGLEVTSAHAPLPLGDKHDEVIGQMAALGCTRLVNPAMPRDYYQDKDSVLRLCELFNKGQEECAANGMALGIHNHWWEFQPVNGVRPYDLFLEHLHPDIFFEIDTYWVKTAGADPNQVIADLGERAPLLHIKDGPANTEEAMVAIGDGVMDFGQIEKSSGGHADWWIVELDRCDTDMLTAVARSHDYLVNKGFGSGA
jgi:sugar phosphate isomerase/epimerase